MPPFLRSDLNSLASPNALIPIATPSRAGPATTPAFLSKDLSPALEASGVTSGVV